MLDDYFHCNIANMDDNERTELIYKTIFDTWRSQVDSSWQRSTYFAAFEIAAIGGCWLLASGEKLLPVGAAIVVSVGGLLLTLIWYLSTKKTQEYVRHWWESVLAIENGLLPTPSPYNFAQQLDRKGKDEYRKLLPGIPVLFSAAWIALFTLSIARFTWLVRCRCLVR